MPSAMDGTRTARAESTEGDGDGGFDRFARVWAANDLASCVEDREEAAWLRWIGASCVRRAGEEESGVEVWAWSLAGGSGARMGIAEGVGVRDGPKRVGSDRAFSNWNTLCLPLRSP